MLVSRCVLLAMVALTVEACIDRSTAADRKRLEQVGASIASEFSLDPWPDTYLRARHRRDGCPSLDRAEALYRLFWSDDSGSWRKDTVFVYLNLEDHRGDFCFQLVLDPTTNRLERTDQAYY